MWEVQEPQREFQVAPGEVQEAQREFQEAPEEFQEAPKGVPGGPLGLLDLPVHIRFTFGSHSVHIRGGGPECEPNVNGM